MFCAVLCCPAGAEALSRYGEEFLAEAERLLGECGKRRELAAGRLEALKLEQEEALELLSCLSLERQERRAGARQASGSQGPGRGSGVSGRGSDGLGRSGEAQRRSSGDQAPKGNGLEPKGRGFVEHETGLDGKEKSLEVQHNLDPSANLLKHQEGSVEQQGNCSLEQQDSSSSTSDRQKHERSFGRRSSVGSDKGASGKRPTTPLSASAKQRALKKALSADATADAGPRRSPAQPAGVIQRPARSVPLRKFPPAELTARPEWQS